ncbi:hypothetical protein NP233_g12937 [Leucocoprinus birnbaumii]|uniref:Major facilitator superfamily (MFS) profile domain-containing protein n=1 Tax=Leucocoprinus birnbaumii TaxID=56174 RepID=A0AAD5VHR3_9AGAR|nr:hypothetical protein NP233_g12937 [Leucocoprinus birnbaumii]
MGDKGNSEATTRGPGCNEVQLTDQTNLLPFKKILTCFMGLGLCVFISQMDAVIVATALPTISTAFSAGSVSSWVPSAYLLTTTSFQPLYGRFSDIFGRKATLTAAMLILVVGNLAAGFSQSILQLIVLRGIAGAGGALFDLARGKYQGIMGSFIIFGYVMGPIIGGGLAQKASWRWVFWISAPMALCTIFVVNFILPLKPVQGNIKSKLLAIDYVGSVLSLGANALVILPIIWGGVTFPWNSAIVLATLISGLLTWVLFITWEWKGARLPIVPMHIFKHSTVCGVYIAMFINGLVVFSSMYYLPQFFQVALGYTPIHAGVFLIPLFAGQEVISWMAGVIVTKTGRYRALIYSGFATWSLACGLISTIKPHTHQSVMVIFMLVASLGSGQTFQTTTVAAQASVSRQDMSVVTAFRNFVRMLGAVLALAIDAALINNTLRSSMQALSLLEDIIKRVIDNPVLLSTPESISLSTEKATLILEQGYTEGFRRVFILNAVLTALATVTSMLLIKHKNLTRDDEEGLRKEASGGKTGTTDDEKADGGEAGTSKIESESN